MRVVVAAVCDPLSFSLLFRSFFFESLASIIATTSAFVVVDDVAVVVVDDVIQPRRHISRAGSCHTASGT